MAELKQMTVDQICNMLNDRYDLYSNTQSVINWNIMNNLPKSQVNGDTIIFVSNFCKYNFYICRRYSSV